MISYTHCLAYTHSSSLVGSLANRKWRSTLSAWSVSAATVARRKVNVEAEWWIKSALLKMSHPRLRSDGSTSNCPVKLSWKDMGFRGGEEVWRRWQKEGRWMRRKRAVCFSSPQSLNQSFSEQIKADICFFEVAQGDVHVCVLLFHLFWRSFLLLLRVHVFLSVLSWIWLRLLFIYCCLLAWVKRLSFDTRVGCMESKQLCSSHN